jgi:hypothetical protein
VIAHGSGLSESRASTGCDGPSTCRKAGGLAQGFAFRRERPNVTIRSALKDADQGNKLIRYESFDNFAKASDDWAVMATAPDPLNVVATTR